MRNPQDICTLTLVAFAVAAGRASISVADHAVFESLDIIGTDVEAPYPKLSSDGLLVATTTNPDFLVTQTAVNDLILWSSCTGALQFTDAFPAGTVILRIDVDISADGKWIVGTVFDGAVKAAFRMSSAGHVDMLGAPIGWAGSEVFGVSADGNTIGCVTASGICRWTSENGFDVASVNGVPITGKPTGLSADGSTIVGEHSGGAFRWNSDGTYDSLGSGVVHAADVSADGSVVVGTTRNHSVIGDAGFRWTAETGLVKLENGVENWKPRPMAVSADGSMIVGEAEGSNWGFIWDAAHGTRLLSEVIATDYGLADEVASWQWLRPMDISANGNVIVGYGNNSHGRLAAWRIIVDPAQLADQPDSDNDGACDLADVCNGNDASGDTDGDGICDDIDEVDNRSDTSFNPDGSVDDGAIDCPEDISVTATTDNGAMVDFDLPATTGLSQKTIYADRASGSMFPIGVTDVSVYLVDTANPKGDPVACTFSVEVKALDATAPTGLEALSANGCFAFGAEAMMIVPILGFVVIQRRRRRPNR